ncbi:MAG: thioesterase [Eubacteriales bacterium]|nr:thioesterase [Eubacteriales bacterium]
MSYSFNGRVRYSETGENGCLTLPGILNYFQDCCTFHSESIGQGMEVLKKRGKGWVLSAWQVVVDRYPRLGEDICTTTWPYDFRGFLGYRNFTMDTAQGERLAYANTLWTHMNAAAGFPEKLQPEDTAGYEINEKLDMIYAPRKISIPKDRTAREGFLVQKHHLDTNHHVNNCQYVSMAADYLPSGFKIHQMRAEYKQQAKFNDMICPEVSVEDGKITVLLNDEGGKVITIVEFN